MPPVLRPQQVIKALEAIGRTNERHLAAGQVHCVIAN